MKTTTRAPASLLLAAVLAGTTSACGTGHEAGDGPSASATASSDASVQDLDRVGSILPGEDWTLVDAYAVGRTEGEYEVNADGASGAEPPEVTVTWRAANDYDGYVADRADVSSPEPVEVLGAPAMLYTYSDHDFTVLRATEGASFIELRATYLSRAELDDFLAGLHTASEEDFAAALADADVTPAR